MVAHVHAAARVAVLEPGAPDAGVLLDHRVGQARLLEADGRQQARHAAADHDDVEFPLRLRRDIGAPEEPARIPPVELHLLEHHRHVLLRHLAGHQEAHHLVDNLFGGRRLQPTAAVAIGLDDLEGLGAHQGLRLLGHEALDLVQEDARGAERSAQQARVPRHVDHRQHQRGDAHLLEGRRDGGVVVRDRGTGRVDALGH